MKALSSKLASTVVAVSPKVRMVVFILTLVLFVLAAGAPCAPGSVGG